MAAEGFVIGPFEAERIKRAVNYFERQQVNEANGPEVNPTVAPPFYGEVRLISSDPIQQANCSGSGSGSGSGIGSGGSGDASGDCEEPIPFYDGHVLVWDSESASYELGAEVWIGASPGVPLSAGVDYLAKLVEHSREPCCNEARPLFMVCNMTGQGGSVSGDCETTRTLTFVVNRCVDGMNCQDTYTLNFPQEVGVCIAKGCSDSTPISGDIPM